MPKYKYKPETAIICLSDGKGGMELDAIKLAKLLYKKLPVVLICKESSFLYAECLENNSKFPVETIKFLSKALSISIIFNLRRLIKKRNIKNVIFFGASELKSMYFAFIGNDINVIVRHGTTKSSKKKDLLHRAIYSCVNYHVAISEHIYKNVFEIIPMFKHTEIKTIYPSFNLLSNKAVEDSKEVLQIIHVGRIASGKGQIDAIKACAILYDNQIDFQLHIIGDIDGLEYFDELSEVVKNCPYKECISISNAVRNINDVYKSANILLFPSYGEGLGNVFLEAISAGLICITYDNTVFPEFEDMGLYFKMVKTGDVTLLSNELLVVASSLDDELSHAHDNLDKIKMKFSSDKEIVEWMSILE